MNTFDKDMSAKALKVFPKHRILVIGNCHNPCVNYINILRSLRYDVFWVGENTQGTGLNLVGPVVERVANDKYPEFGDIVVLRHIFSLKGLLEFLKMDFSIILHFQNWWYPDDVEKSPIPYIYIPSEGWHPYPPKCAHACTYSSIAMRDVLEREHPNIPLVGYLPYPLNVWMEDLTEHKDEERIYDCGFSGGLHAFDELYKERRDILFWLKYQMKGKEMKMHWPDADRIGSHYGKTIKKEGDGSLDAKDYRKFLCQCRFGLSIPTYLGTPFRDLEVMAAKGGLITKRTRDLDAMGFKEGVHYFTYETKEEIPKIIKNTKEYLRKSAAEGGHAIVHSAHLVIHRIPALELMFEMFNIVGHGRLMGLWKPIRKENGGVVIAFRQNPNEKVFTHCIFIGPTAYYPIAEENVDLNESIQESNNC
jgi:hypothetical protein